MERGVRVCCLACVWYDMYLYTTGSKGTQGRSELSELVRHMTEFEKAAEECAEERELKRRKLDAELEERRREAEMKHEERMMYMLCTLSQQMLGRTMPNWFPPSEDE